MGVIWEREAVEDGRLDSWKVLVVTWRFILYSHGEFESPFLTFALGLLSQRAAAPVTPHSGRAQGFRNTGELLRGGAPLVVNRRTRTNAFRLDIIVSM